MKLKQLEGLLGSLEQFSDPKIELEQYPTGPHIASRMLFSAENSYGDITNKVVADFGCGCGTLGLAAALLGAEHVIGVDIDAESLEVASANAEDLELDMEFVQCDVRNFGWRGQIIDTVVMNPPFGTRRKGADMDFLSVALKVASQAVYSLHKTSTRDVWSLIRRFDQSQRYKPFVSRCIVLGDLMIGSVRELNVKSGLPATRSTERLELLDDTQRILGVAIVGGDRRLKQGIL